MSTSNCGISSALAAIFLTCAVAGCSKHEQSGAEQSSGPAPSVAQEAPKADAAQTPEHPAINAGTLLTDEDLQAIVGAPVQDRKVSERTDRGLAVSQCYFEMPTAAQSMVLAVWEGSGASDSRAKNVWKGIFDRDFDKEEEGEKEESGEKKAKPERVPGVGDEAFLIPQKFGGVIYVLKGSNFFRLSVGGGPSDSSEKKSATLKAAAEAVLNKL